MRLVITSTLTAFFTFLTLASAMAQGPWAPAAVPQGEYVPNQLIIRFSSVENSDALKQEFGQIHGVQVNVYQIDEAGYYFLIDVLDGINTPTCERDWSVISPLPCTMCDILGNPGGGGPMDRDDGLWPNYYGNAGTTSNDQAFPDFSQQDMFGNGGFNPLVGEPYISGLGESDPCYEGNILPGAPTSMRRKVKIAILDSGIAPDNYDNFFKYPEYGPQQSMVSWPSIPPIIPNTGLPQYNVDPNGHGTAVAFLLAHDFVNRNTQHKVQLHSYRILDETATGTLADALRSLDYAINDGMDIINLSFGFREIDCIKNDDEGYITYAKYVFGELFSRARANNILIFTSAGNDENDLDIAPQWPASLNSHSNLFTVGADGCTPGVKWEYSNFNEAYVDLMAPGYKIAVPFAGEYANNPGYYINVSGTSFATPLAASVAATYFSTGGYAIALCALEDDSDTSQEGALPENSRLGSIFDIDIDDCQPGQGGTTHCGDCVIAERGSAYPNPFGDQISIETNVNNGLEATLRILNSSGHLILQGKSSSETVRLNTATLSPGVYFLQITDTSGTRVQRGIKIYFAL